jgi:MFS family permease
MATVRAPSEQAAGRNLAVLWLGQFASIAGLTVIVPFLPFYVETLGAAGPSRQLWTGIALLAPAVTQALAAPLWGRLGDRCGRKWMVVRALLGIGVSVLLMGLARSPLQFVTCRLAQGVFGGVVDAAAAFVGSEASPTKRGWALGRLQTAIAAGALAGPLAGGLLADAVGLRVVFVATATAIVMSGLLAAGVLRERGSQRVITPAARPAAAAASPVAVSPPPPGVFRQLLRSRTPRSSILAGLCAQVGAYGLIVVFALHVRSLLVHPERAASWVGLLQAVTWAAAILGGLWWGKRNDRRHAERNLVAALAGCALGVGLQAVVMPVTALIPLRVIQGFCFSAVSQCVFLQASRAAEPHRQGAYIGAANSMLVLGQVLGGAVGAVVSSVAPPAVAIGVMGTVFGVGSLVALSNDAAVTATAPTTRTQGS